MKRSQNLEMVDGDDRNDMEDMEHEGEDEDHVLTTMAIHKALAKASLNSIWKNTFPNTFDSRLECDEWLIIGWHLM